MPKVYWGGLHLLKEIHSEQFFIGARGKRKRKEEEKEEEEKEEGEEEVVEYEPFLRFFSFYF